GDQIKAAERAAAGAPGSVLGSVPFGQPALSLAAQLRRRAQRAGAPAELADLPHAPGDQGQATGDHGRAAADEEAQPVSAIGAELFALVARAVQAGLDPEMELRAAARGYAARVR